MPHCAGSAGDMQKYSPASLDSRKKVPRTDSWCALRRLVQAVLTRAAQGLTDLALGRLERSLVCSRSPSRSLVSCFLGEIFADRSVMRPLKIAFGIVCWSRCLPQFQLITQSAVKPAPQPVMEVKTARPPQAYVLRVLYLLKIAQR